jgi:adenylate cyclase
MDEKEVKRKLAAILSADVKGYSRLMEEDEVTTVRTLEEYRAILSELVEKHQGRVVDSPGDNLLAQFTSVVDATEAAVEIQKELEAKNADLPENRRMEFRIGINLGDVIAEGERIYGDGVNIAARVESLSDSGGICVSGTAYDQIAKKLPLGYEYLGEQTVKNIEKPVRAYRVLMDPEAAGKVIGEKRPISRNWRWAAVALIVVAGALAIWNFYLRPPFEPASVQRMAYPLPDKPSIAVLPFNNISGDPKQEYFSDGITEEIITALSKTPKVLVIARNSTFTYKGKPVKVQQVAEELGVQFVLEGSVRKAENQVRITAQLIDALSGHHLWAERYDRGLKDLFTVQDDITKNIITALQVKLTMGENARLFARGTESLEAYLRVLQGLEFYWQYNSEGNTKSREIFKEAIELDPDYAVAHTRLGWTHWIDVWLRFGKSPRDSIKQAFQSAKKAIALDDLLPTAHGLFASLYLLTRKHELAISEAEKAVALSPNMAELHVYLGQILVFAGKPEEAILHLEKSIRLDPFARSSYFHILGMAYREAGRYEEAITACQKAIQRGPNNLFAHMILAATYIMIGRDDEAHAEATEVLRINPKFSLERMVKVRPHIDPDNTARFADVLRKAGLK